MLPVQLTVADLMTEEVFTIQSTATVAQAIALMQAHKLRSLIVERNDFQDSYGILTERDVVCKVTAPGLDPHLINVFEVMRKPCIHFYATMTLREAARRFQETGIQRAPVLQAGNLIGIISITDLLMKQPINEPPPQDTLSQRIQKAIRHVRVVSDSQDQLAQECLIAWEVKEALETDRQL
ncbi:MAG: CBS domain-containing protein [Leptolyngbya sp. SIO4C1]|nr:CBS domain-containing protein [Leptolyngbya sp. SIO4C1]